jgi:4-amino-4-deoxy-L-arabinose transferase-like glycosyltransferase
MWARPALAGLLVATAVLYLWGLGASGYANDFYAAAVQAGTKSWKALFFGSLDSSNFITVDKPPASLWMMGLSGRIFGFSSWSMLVPQALEGVASVGLLYAAVRRWHGPGAGLLAGAILALTPVATLMFRFNNPDALLVLLLVAAAYCTVRATEKAGTRWLVLAGLIIGFAFITKMMQAFLVVPGFALVYLVAAPAGILRRLWQLLAGAAAIVVGGGWWVAITALWPASSRPYIGGSTNNSVMQLALGYNGLGRLLGQGGGGGGRGGGGGGGFGGGGGGGFGGATGITRMFSSEFGTQISWLLPAAALALVAGLWLTRRAPRTDQGRASLLLWGGWLLTTVLVFSFMSGIIHPYYTVALAPPIGALIAIVGRDLWQRRESPASRGAMAVLLVVTGVWAYVLLDRDPTWYPALRFVVLIGAILVAIGLLVVNPAPQDPASVPAVSDPASFMSRRSPKLMAVVGVAAVLIGLAGPAAYALDTAGTAHTGSIPVAGPGGGGAFGGPGGGQGGRAAFGGRTDGGSQGRPPGGFSGRPPGGFTGRPPGSTGQTPGGTAQTRPGGTGGPGGFGGQSASSALVTLLKATNTRWAAATMGSQSAATLQLASGKAIMAMGGFSGSDPAPTLAQFESYVAKGQIGYYVAGGGMGGGPGGGQGSTSQISTWVAAHYTATTVGGQTVYNLSHPKATT